MRVPTQKTFRRAGQRTFRFSTRRDKKPSVKGLRLGIIRPDYGKGPNAQPEVERVFEEALAVLTKQGASLFDAKMPDLPTDPAANTIISVEGASAFEDVIRDKGAPFAPRGR